MILVDSFYRLEDCEGAVTGGADPGAAFCINSPLPAARINSLDHAAPGCLCVPFGASVSSSARFLSASTLLPFLNAIPPCGEAVACQFFPVRLIAF